MSDLIKRLREAQTNTNKCNEAADAIEAKDASIDHYKSGLESAVEDIAKLKALCDQLGNALESHQIMTRPIYETHEALTAWRASK